VYHQRARAVRGLHQPARVLREAVALSWRANAGATLLAGVLSAAAGFTPVLAAWLAQLLINDLTRHPPDAGRALLLVVAGAAATLTTVVAGQAGAVVSASLGRAITLTVQDTLYAKVDTWAGLRYFEDPAMQDRLRLAEQGASAAPLSITTMISQAIGGIITILGFAGALVLLWPPMGLVIVVAAIPAIAAQRNTASRGARTAEMNISAIRRQVMFQKLLTDPSTAKDVRVYGLGGLLRTWLRASLQETTGRTFALTRRTARSQSGIGLLAAAVTALAGVVAVREVIAGRLTLGGMTLVTAAVAGVQSAVAGLLSQGGSTMQALALMRHYVELLEAEPDLPDGSLDAPPLRHAIQFRDVWFRYDSAGPWVLRGVTLTLLAGQTTGLVGVNGAGKSTLVRLLCRLYDPERGEICWDGTDIRQFRIETLRRRLGATFQDFAKYEMTAADNIGVGDLPRMTDRPAVHRAAATAGIDATLTALPDGYDTLLSQVFLDSEDRRGVYLSGGQWQRIALARSMMRDRPDLVILDEPNSGLDAAAEDELHRSLRSRRSRGTTLLISHRLGALRDADRLVVLADGQVEQAGTHDELLASGGGYERLFRLQAAGYRDG
jgi:ATP-binding cassette, subfamily B, bacterial